MFSGKERQRSGDYAQPPRPVTTQGKSNPEGAITAYLGPDTHIEGTLRFQHSVLIEGSFKGEIHSGGSLVIGESAVVEARITTLNITIKGVVKGTIEASERVCIQGNGQVYGDITTASLQMDESVVFQGSCSMPKGTTTSGGGTSTTSSITTSSSTSGSSTIRNSTLKPSAIDAPSWKDEDKIYDAVMKTADDKK